ncbi:MAG TPA: hypothetical protein ACFCUD_08270, partial [Cyclobacteriaceae bacterium]
MKKRQIQLRLLTVFIGTLLIPLIAQGQNALELKGLMSFQTGADGGNRERGIHLIANQDIADLSVYGIGIANNGGGSDGREMDLPAISVSAGEDILFIRDSDSATIANYFGTCFTEFEHKAVDGGINFNGDDAVELYLNSEIIEIYGDTLYTDDTVLAWDYTGSWGYKIDDVWTYGGVDCSVGSTATQESTCPYPLCNFNQEEEVPDGLALKGVFALRWSTEPGGNSGKAVHLRAKEDIADLSVYAIGVANNGGGTDSIEYRFPAIAVSAGDDILLAREDSTLSAYFGDCAGE